MPATLQKINGVWRNTFSTMVTVDGVCRESDALQRVDGVWRQVHEHAPIDVDTLIGFHVVYTYDPTMKSEQFPFLKSTKNLPVTMNLTGDNAGSMDTTTKGVVYHYEREMPYNEGVCVYRGTLYAEFPGDLLIPINPYRFGMEPWSTFQFADLQIQVDGYEGYESDGYYTSGWNSIFHKEQFLDPSKFPDKESHKNRNVLNTYDILPVESRDDDFSPEILIGISRNITTTDDNMAGSFGTLDHTYKAIYVNGVAKPFVVEIFH
jgi:hypothetical protein